jgi:hypothetical protein
VQLIAQLWQELAESLALPEGQHTFLPEVTDSLPESDVRQIIQECMSDISSDQEFLEAEESTTSEDTDNSQPTYDDEPASCYDPMFK